MFDVSVVLKLFRAAELFSASVRHLAGLVSIIIVTCLVIETL